MHTVRQTDGGGGVVCVCMKERMTVREGQHVRVMYTLLLCELLFFFNKRHQSLKYVFNSLIFFILLLVIISIFLCYVADGILQNFIWACHVILF
jgi:hypothetical protein